jgi:hypothetical protein
LKEKQDPLETIAANLGIVKPPSIKEFFQLLQNEIFIIAIRTNGLGSKGFSNLLRWTAGVNIHNEKKNIKIIIERNKEQLKAESEKIFDNLPDEFDKMFTPVPSNKNAGLLSYYWTKEIKKKFWGIF